jgi:hypothetical protein
MLVRDTKFLVVSVRRARHTISSAVLLDVAT